MKKTLLFIFAFATSIITNSQVLDTSFDTDGILTQQLSNNPSKDLCLGAHLQNDGKILYVGTHNDINGFVARLNPDGSFDSTFNTNGFLLSYLPVFEYVTTQNDNKILMASRNYLARLNSDGSNDNSFNTIFVSQSFMTRALKIQSDGKILLAGYEYNGNDRDFAIYRFNSNGTIDTTFDNDGKAIISITIEDLCYDIAILNDGKIILAGQTKISGSSYNAALVKLNNDGSLDTNFDGDGKITHNLSSMNLPNSLIRSICIQPDDKMLVISAGKIIRFNSNGTIDTTFGNNGLVSFNTNTVTSIGVDLKYNQSIKQKILCLNDGKILISYNVGFSLILKIHRFNINGSVDTTFGTNGSTTINNENICTNFLFIKPDNKIITGGYQYNYLNLSVNDNIRKIKCCLFSEQGIFENSYTQNLSVSSDRLNHFFEDNSQSNLTYSLVNNVDGFAKYTSYGQQLNYQNSINNLASIDILEKKTTHFFGASFSTELSKFNLDGSLDTSFGTNGSINLFETSLNNSIASISDIKYHNNKLFIGFEFSESSVNPNNKYYSYGICRLTDNGSLDTTFGNNGYFTTRFNYFGPNYDEFPSNIKFQSDGKIIMTGKIYNNIYGLSTNSIIGITRIDSNGVLDNTFGSNGKIVTTLNTETQPIDLHILPDDKFIINTQNTTLNYTITTSTIKYNSNGTLDTSFGNNGILNDNGNFNKMVIQSDGKILKIGSINSQITSCRYLSDGNIDVSWGNNGYLTTPIGLYSIANSAIINSQNKLVIAGYSYDGIRENATIIQFTDLLLGNIEFIKNDSNLLVYPNPIVNETTFEYELISDENITIALYDMQGKEVKSIVKNQKQNSGKHLLILTLTELNSGNYFLKFSTLKGSQSLQLVKK